MRAEKIEAAAESVSAFSSQLAIMSLRIGTAWLMLPWTIAASALVETSVPKTPENGMDERDQSPIDSIPPRLLAVVGAVLSNVDVTHDAFKPFRARAMEDVPHASVDESDAAPVRARLRLVR